MLTRLWRFLAASRRGKLRAVRQVDEPAVTLHRSGDLEARRSEQPDALPHRPRDRHQDLRREEAVLARLALRRVDDVVAEEAPGPDRRPGHAERRARVVGVDDRYPAGTHRSAADRAQVRVVVLDLGAEVRPGLHHGGQPVSEALQVAGRCRSCRRRARGRTSGWSCRVISRWNAYWIPYSG